MKKNNTYQVLNIKVIDFLSQPFTKKNISIPNWLIIVLVEIMAVMLHTGLSILFYGKAFFSTASLLWSFWGALIGSFILILVEYNIHRFLQATKEMSDFYDSQQISFSKWKLDTFQLGKQVWFSIIFATTIFPTTYVFFKLTTIDFITLKAVVLYANLIFIGNGFYWLIFLPTATYTIKKNAKQINFFDLKNTLWIRNLEKVYERAALSASIIGVMVILPLVFNPRLENITPITTGWLILVWLLVLVPYFVAQNSITNIVNNERLSTITQLQAQITQILSLPPSSITETRLQNLLQIYEKAINAKSKIFSFNIQIFNSIILPLLSFIVINFNKIILFIKTFAN